MLEALMDFKYNKQTICCWFTGIGFLGLQILWYFLHVVVNLWYLALGIANALESYCISSGLLKRYKSLNIDKLRYLAVVVESEEACDTSKVIELLHWLVAIGAKYVCLYDAEGVLKKSKESILAKFNNAALLEDIGEKGSLLDKKHITLEFTSWSDGKEAVAKAANVLFQKYMKLGDKAKNQEEQIFTEAHMSEALRAVGCRGPEPDLLLVYGPARCHLGFPAWRIRYTEIVHMGPLKTMSYGFLIKAIYQFMMVRQNYGR